MTFQEYRESVRQLDLSGIYEGLGTIHQLHDLQSLQFWHPAQEGTQQGLWATETNPNGVLSFMELKHFQLLILFDSLSFHKISWKRFPKKSQLGYLWESRNPGGIMGMPMELLARRWERRHSLERKGAMEEQTHVAADPNQGGISTRAKALPWHPRAMQWEGRSPRLEELQKTGTQPAVKEILHLGGIRAQW